MDFFECAHRKIYVEPTKLGVHCTFGGVNRRITCELVCKLCWLGQYPAIAPEEVENSAVVNSCVNEIEPNEGVDTEEVALAEELQQAVATLATVVSVMVEAFSPKSDEVVVKNDQQSDLDDAVDYVLGLLGVKRKEVKI